MSYELDPMWDPYYEELDTEKRRTILQQLLSEQEDDGANTFRERIFHYRYVDEKNPKHMIDRFLGIGCMYRDIAANASPLSFFTKKQVIKYSKELGLDQISSLSQKEKACLYQEYKHAFKRYFQSCMSGNYHAMFGIVQPEDDVRIAAARKDIAVMTTGIAKQFRMEDTLALWLEAGNDALAELPS